ncbi:FCD domain-containing protein [Paenalcaligenes niemegkensis]|uniref:GntR family transcriptional regulator n=1 Tax=Paenalcaligenes niemegkensis TaxID=2895469 RepID=UPI001EE907B0|nr:FCD domain-containing protein [Paenalcaligenes niemegkensis]MCQ9618276.1 FCD domain-containing protein [Paenalcaligenes niemegkensis]
MREALMRLSSEGFVDMEGQRGFRVSPITLSTFREITDARVALEALALTRALEVGTDDWEASIVANFHRLSRRTAIDPVTGLISADWDIAHREFHYSLISGCDNQWLKSFWEILFDQAYRYRQIAVTRGFLYRDDLVEHRALMEQVLERNLPGSLAASQAHITSTYEVVLKVLAEDTA